MKIAAILVLLIIGMSTAYATSSMLLLHVGQAAGNGGVVSSCTGTIDLSTGCVMPMLR